MWRQFLSIGIVVLSVVIAACEPQHTVVDFGGSTMGTSYTVKLVDPPDSLDRERVQSEVASTLARIDDAMSTYKEDSELSRINRYRDTQEPISLSPELTEVLAEARRIHRLSGGAYDVTIGPLVNLWGFGPERGEGVPARAAIDKARTRVGFDKLELDVEHQRLRKRDPDVYIDLSSIAKGYAVDQAARALEAMDIANYMIELGGELRLEGINPEGGFWRIAVEKPESETLRNVHRVLQLSGVSMATSGDYRNFLEEGGRRYTHTIDPQTGGSVRHGLASVTVVAPQCMTADAWATALMVLGLEKGYQLAKSQKLAAFFIIRTDDGFEERQTVAFEQYMDPVDLQNPDIR